MTQTTSNADLRRARDLLRRSIQSAQDLVAHDDSVRRSAVDRQVMLGKIAAAIPDASSRRRESRNTNATRSSPETAGLGTVRRTG